MQILSTDDILSIHRAAIEAGLVRSRETLLSGLGEELRTGLFAHGVPKDQMLLDLNKLNALEKLVDGSAPLATWLKNAIRLAEPRPEVDIFKRMLEQIEREAGRVGVTIESGSKALRQLPPTDANPFSYGSPVPPSRFLGRRREVLDLKSRIGAVTAQSVSLVGLPQSGRSSLLAYIAGRPDVFFRREQRPLVVSLDLQSKQYHSPSGIVEGLRRGIQRELGAPPWRQEDNTNGFEVDDGLKRLCDQGVRLVLLIDELERIAARLDQFQDWGEDFRAKASAGYFSLVIATRRPLSVLYERCGLTSPFETIFSVTRLGAFTPDEQRALVMQGFEEIGRTASVADLGLVDELSGGLPLYAQMAAHFILRCRDHEAARRAFEEEASLRFPALWKELSEQERNTLQRVVSGVQGVTPDRAVREGLERHGLLRADGRLFSVAFAAFVRGQR